jgi:hypothetical protein
MRAAMTLAPAQAHEFANYSGFTIGSALVSMASLLISTLATMRVV